MKFREALEWIGDISDTCNWTIRIYGKEDDFEEHLVNTRRSYCFMLNPKLLDFEVVVTPSKNGFNFYFRKEDVEEVLDSDFI